MTRRAPLILGVALASIVLAACGTSMNRPERATLAALALPTPHLPVSPPTPHVRCVNPTASLRPPSVMPAPGSMPAGSFMARIRHRGYLIAGVDQNTLLFASFNPLSRTIEGFEIDLLKRIAHAIFGNKRNDLELKAITTSERIPDVRNGSVDLVADAMTITCERRQQVDFSSVYYDASQKILVPANSPVRSVKDLGGKLVCATRGSTSLDTLKTLVPRPTPHLVDQRTDCLVALQEGSVSAITSDDSILLGFKAQDPDTKIVGSSFAREPYGMAIAKAHPEFVRFVNGVLAQMRGDGTWRAIYAHWLGKLVTRIPAPPTAQYRG
jgi:polar amino acid transport system substrate-binding protein